MKIRKLFSVALIAVFLSPSVFAMDDYLYRSPNKIDFIKLDKAKKDEKEGGLKHPYSFTQAQIRSILSSVRFNKKVLMMKDVEDRRLYSDDNIDFLSSYLVEAFNKVNNEQVITVSYFTNKSKFLVPNDRLTIFRTYVKEDGLHIKFLKVYAKMIGDRTTAGSERITNDAQGIRVSLELQPGQNRISWKPEELVFDLNYFTASGVPKQPETLAAAPKPEKRAATVPASEDPAKSIGDRLKALERLHKDELITDKEYQQKRADLLRQL
jgi:hypothetical protein